MSLEETGNRTITYMKQPGFLLVLGLVNLVLLLVVLCNMHRTHMIQRFQSHMWRGMMMQGQMMRGGNAMYGRTMQYDDQMMDGGRRMKMLRTMPAMPMMQDQDYGSQGAQEPMMVAPDASTSSVGGQPAQDTMQGPTTVTTEVRAQ